MTYMYALYLLFVDIYDLKGSVIRLIDLILHVYYDCDFNFKDLM